MHALPFSDTSSVATPRPFLQRRWVFVHCYIDTTHLLTNFIPTSSAGTQVNYVLAPIQVISILSYFPQQVPKGISISSFCDPSCLPRFTFSPPIVQSSVKLSVKATIVVYNRFRVFSVFSILFLCICVFV